MKQPDGKCKLERSAYREQRPGGVAEPPPLGGGQSTVAFSYQGSILRPKPKRVGMAAATSFRNSRVLALTRKAKRMPVRRALTDRPTAHSEWHSLT